MTDQITMKKARKMYRASWLANGGDRSTNFRKWARTMIANRSVSFAHPVGKLAQIGGRHS